MRSFNGMTHEEYVAQVRLEVVATARALLADELSFIEGARKINSLRRDAEVSDYDKIFDVFVAIDSETDALPVGKVRELWDKGALAKLQPEIERAESWARTFGSAACRALIEKLGN